MIDLSIALKAFLLCLSLIIAIGAQNAYLLKLGLLAEHRLKAVLFFTLSDLFLIGLGVFGLGSLIAHNQTFINSIAIFGILFLSFYALLSFRSCFKKQSLNLDEKQANSSTKEVLSMLFVFTYLNPHAYLDTVLLVGGIGASSASRASFLLGAVIASFLWFFALGYGARFLAPLFKKPYTWKVLDFSIGIFMLYIAYGLKDLIKL